MVPAMATVAEGDSVMVCVQLTATVATVSLGTEVVVILGTLDGTGKSIILAQMASIIYDCI